MTDAYYADLSGNGKGVVDLDAVYDDVIVTTAGQLQRQRLQGAITALGMDGGIIPLPRGRMYVDSELDYSVFINGDVSLEGQGGSYNALIPSLAIAASDTILIKPAPGYVNESTFIRGFAIHNPVDGTRTNRDGIRIDTQVATSNLTNHVIENMTIGQGTGYAINAINNAAANVNGGYYGSTIRNNKLKGGLRLYKAGDSIQVSKNIIEGNGVGLDISLINGASGPYVVDNNITSKGGAVRHRGGNRAVYSGLNVENREPGALAANDGAVFNVSAEDERVTGGSLTDSLISAFGTNDATHLIKIGKTGSNPVIGFVLDRVTVLSGSLTHIAIEIADTAVDTCIGQLFMQDGDLNGIVDLFIVDNGVGTRGVEKTLTLGGGWTTIVLGSTTFSAVPQLPKFKKDMHTGMVHFYGGVGGGAGSIGTLPVGFRPATKQTLPAFWQNAGSYGPCEVEIDTNGVVTPRNRNGNVAYWFDVTFHALNGATSITPE